MKSFALLALAATALAQSSTPAGCSPSTSGTFQISTVKVTSSKKRDLSSRQQAGILTLSLQNGDLKDQAGRTGYIASNYQFQFDAPVQSDARETSGFSLCNNQSLALGSSAIFYQCNSGDINNLYSKSIGEQCIPIYIEAVRQGGSASQISDGQPQAAAPGVSQISDGQPQAATPGPVVSQISDGQPQAASPRPVVSEINDGQPQAPPPAAPSAALVTQISDGQPQAGTPRPVVSQISDGQPQAPPPAPTSRPLVSQISDGQPQAPVATGNVSKPSAPPAQFTGGAVVDGPATGALIAGLAGVLAML